MTTIKDVAQVYLFIFWLPYAMARAVLEERNYDYPGLHNMGRDQ
jgi:hypothetical protein